MPLHCFLDIGSNSVRALLVRSGEGGPEVLDDISRTTKLARGLPPRGGGRVEPRTLADESAAATISAVTQVQRMARSQGAVDFYAVATWALRTADGGATDASSFLSRLCRETGVKAEVLSSEEECRLTFAGATSSLSLARGPHVVLDIGGGTLNLAWGMPAAPSRPAAAFSGAWRSEPFHAFHQLEDRNGRSEDTLRDSG